jgi:hypothetical protein
MPDRTRQGFEIRANIHTAASALHDNLKNAKKLAIPIDYFTEDVNTTTINRILRTRLVIAFVPDFEDESNDRISHYILFVIHNYQTYDLGIKNLETILPDFPKNLIKVPVTPVSPPKSTPQTPTVIIETNHQSDLEAFAYMLQSPAFARSTSTINIPPPTTITTPKRPHIPTGETVTPLKQKSKSQVMPINLPPDNAQTSDTATTSTQDSLSYPTFPEHQNEDIMMDEDEYFDHNDEEEEIPDTQYEFCLEHSQPTRLEIMDALGIARSISTKRYKETYHYITRHGNAVDIEQLKHFAARPQTPPQHNRAHNDSSALTPRKK